MRTCLPMVLSAALTATLALAAPPPPVSLPTMIPAGAPNATVDLGRAMTTLQVNIAGVPAAVALSGTNIGLAALLFLNPGSSLTARVVATNSTGTTAPPGSYLVRFNFTNVGASSSMSLTTDSGIAVSCPLVARPGYTNGQSCDLVVTTSGGAFSVTANSLAGVAQLEVTSVQVFKVR